jgi:hypothetical protein
MEAHNEEDDDEEGVDVDTEGGIGIVHHDHPDYEVLAKRLRDFDDHEIEEEAKRRRKSTPPPKKLNNEQWDLMFDRLVKYKEDHGVRRDFAVKCMQSSIVFLEFTCLTIVIAAVRCGASPGLLGTKAIY